MRVTFNQVRDGLTAINTAAEQFADAQWQVSTGLRVRQASDDPVGAKIAIADHAAIGSLDAYSKTADSTISRLTVADSMLSDIVNKISAAQTTVLSVQGSQTSQSQRESAATAIQGAFAFVTRHSQAALSSACLRFRR